MAASLHQEFAQIKLAKIQGMLDNLGSRCNDLATMIRAQPDSAHAARMTLEHKVCEDLITDMQSLYQHVSSQAQGQVQPQGQAPSRGGQGVAVAHEPAAAAPMDMSPPRPAQRRSAAGAAGAAAAPAQQPQQQAPARAPAAQAAAQPQAQTPSAAQPAAEVPRHPKAAGGGMGKPSLSAGSHVGPQPGQPAAGGPNQVLADGGQNWHMPKTKAKKERDRKMAKPEFRDKEKARKAAQRARKAAERKARQQQEVGELVPAAQ